MSAPLASSPDAPIPSAVSHNLSPLFVSHGSPMVVTRQTTPAFDFFTRELGPALDGVRAIVVISAHWQEETPVVSTAARPETIHDFFGFPEPLYRLRYDASGAPELAAQIATLIGAGQDAGRGLDHGAWMPLIMARPAADIPVFQLSMLTHGDARDHYELGRKLRPLRDMGVLVLASGAMTHNLRAIDRREGPIDPWAREFTGWMVEKTATRDIDALLDYRAQAPHARMAHPEDDHLMPFFVALGAAPENFDARTLHDSFEFGNLAMTALRFYDHTPARAAA